MNRTPNPGNQHFPAYLFVIFWLSILAALLAWKAAAYSEIFLVRQYLGMTEPSAPPVWWAGAASIAALVIVFGGYLLVKKRRSRHRNGASTGSGAGYGDKHLRQSPV
jgi:hypothetical protein